MSLLLPTLRDPKHDIRGCGQRHLALDMLCAWLWSQHTVLDLSFEPSLEPSLESEIQRYRTTACKRLNINPDTATDDDLFSPNPERFLKLVLECVVDIAQTRVSNGGRPYSARIIEDILHFVKSHHKTLSERTTPEDWTENCVALKDSLAKDDLLSKEEFIRPLLTIDDLIFLIEEDTMAHATLFGWIRLEAAGGNMMGLYHLAFLFGVQSGIRPGSLWGSTKDTHDETWDILRWKDVKIWRCHQVGGFVVRVRFRRIKGRRNAISQEARKRLELHFRTPSDKSMLPMSIPERLLTELIGLDYLQDHRHVASLLHGTDHFINIADKALEMPVFHSRIAHDGIMRSDKVNNYLKDRELEFGIPPVHSFYPFRALAGSLAERAYGEANAQKLLAYRVGSGTYRRHYDIVCDHIDMTGLLLERDANCFENGTAVEPAFILRGDFDEAESSLDITDAVDARDIRTRFTDFATELRIQADGLTEATIQERKKELGRCRLLDRLVLSEYEDPRKVFMHTLVQMKRRMSLPVLGTTLLPPDETGQQTQADRDATKRNRNVAHRTTKLRVRSAEGTTDVRRSKRLHTTPKMTMHKPTARTNPEWKRTSKITTTLQCPLASERKEYT